MGVRMRFRQRLFSWLDSYDIYNETGETLYTVEGKLAWGTACTFWIPQASILLPFRKRC